jgi:hypothetical protein
MKRYVLSILLMSMLVPTAVWCGEFEEIAELEAIERQMEHREREMELEHREAEMGFEREMQQLELEERKTHIEREHAGHRERHGKKGAAPLLLLILVVHILVAVWVYTDIRKLNSGSGIWIVIALLTGLLGTLVYAVVRMGDARIEKS